MKKALLAVGVVGALALSSTNRLAAGGTGTPSILRTANAAGGFDLLLEAVEAAGLTSALQGPGPFTVFAPVDQAFLDLPPATLQSLFEPQNIGQLQSILTFHVVPGSFDSTAVLGSSFLTTLQGQRLDITQDQAGNLFVDQAQIVAPDIVASNGIIHVIDAVLQPVTQNIPQVAQGAGVFNTLLQAVDAADLENLLSRPAAKTVFAPTDAAFAALDPALLNSLLQPENKAKLIELLAYHVVPGNVYADQAVAAGAAATLNGQSVTITGDLTNGVMINASNVVTADIEASNGVIHIIDTVLIPPRF